MENGFNIKKGLIVNGVSSGTTVLDVQGTQGQLFSVTDSLYGILMSVNDVSGLPILEVTSDDTVKMGTYGQNTLVASGLNVGVGTDYPLSKIDIQASSASSTGGIRIRGYTTPSDVSYWGESELALRYSGTYTNVISSIGNSYFNSNLIGNFGIGTSTPQKRVEAISNANDFVSIGVYQIGVGQWTGIHFGYRESDTRYRKSAIVFERTDLTQSDGQGKIHILNGPQGSSNSATLSDSKFTIAENGNIGVGFSTGSELTNNKFSVNGTGYYYGVLTIKPVTSNYCEGIRIGDYGGWSNVQFKVDTTSLVGYQTGQWILGVNPANTFCITKASTEGATVTPASGLSIPYDLSNLVFNGQNVYHTGNFSPGNYLPLSGGNMTGMIQGQTSTGAIAVNAQGTPSFEVYTSGANAAYMTFHRAGSYAVRFGLDTDNVLKVGGWSIGAAAYPILHTGNYTIYTDPIIYRGSTSTGNFQTFQSTSGVIRFDQVVATENLSNPPGGYNYGGVLSLRGINFGFQLWGSHTGDFYFKTQWDNDQSSGWRAVLNSVNYTSYAVSTTYNSTLNSDSRNSRGVTRLYRADDNSDYSVQHTWTGSHWFLRGYTYDTLHAECRVGYADLAASVTNGVYTIGDQSISGLKHFNNPELRIGSSDSYNYISFRGTTGDAPGSFSHTYIGERLYYGSESSELFLFKGNDIAGASGPDRIRLAASEILIDTYTSPLTGTFNDVASSASLFNRFRLDELGNIGIGTSTNVEKININGNIAFGTNGSACKIVHNTSTSSIDFIIV